MATDTPPTSAASNWTGDKPGRSNNSVGYLAIAREVEQLIRGDAYKLIAGQADATARLIVSNLAHRFGFAPDEDNADYRELVEQFKVRHYIETGVQK